MKNKIYQFIYFITCLFPVNALAATLPPGRPITLDFLDDAISDIAIFLIRISMILAVIFIVWSGITYMYAGDDTKKVEEARARLKSGIIGAAIVLGVGVIIWTIAGVITGQFFCQGAWDPVLKVCI